MSLIMSRVHLSPSTSSDVLTGQLERCFSSFIKKIYFLLVFCKYYAPSLHLQIAIKYTQTLPILPQGAVLLKAGGFP
jgi:hypothetical protein